MKQIGIINKNIIDTLHLEIPENSPILLGETNIKHMKKSHPDDYNKYKDEISNILRTPDYVGVNPKDNSLEYVKDFIVNDEFVKVAVRISTKGKFFARSLYILNRNRTTNFISKGTLKKIDNS